MGQSGQAYKTPYVECPLQAAASRGDEELVTLLLQCHADVNHPACGRKGQTALQSICARDAVTLNEGALKLNIINAAPRTHGSGHTALQGAAMRGDYEVAILLLQRGADVQAPSHEKALAILAREDALEMLPWFEPTVLDFASFHGKLDMVKLLLNADGLSGLRGDTEYIGAIKMARHNGHFATAGLIQAHAAENARLGRRNPYSAIPQRNFKEYYGADPDE